MSISTLVRVNCDKCENTHGELAGVKARAVKASAKAAGWKVGKSKDFCPSCSAEIDAAIKAAKAGET